MHESSPKLFRPRRFQELVGQEAIVKTLKNSIKWKRVARAYLFCGGHGTGKTTLARLFAKALNCIQIETAQEPCNKCPSCLSLIEGKSMDVLEIDGASNRGIDDIRQINETVGYRSLHHHYKIYIIDEVHMLTKEAFNALLKTVEDPPERVLFFFATTEPHKIPSTILSRCQRFELYRLTPKQIIEKLRRISSQLKVNAEEEALRVIANAAQGSVRDAEILLDQLACYGENTITLVQTVEFLGITPRALFFELDRAVQSHHLPFAFHCIDTIFSQGKDPAIFLESLIEHYRTLLIIKLSLPLQVYLSEEELRQYVETASIYSNEDILYILDYLIEWAHQGSPSFKRATLEMILLHIIRSQKRVSIASLIEKLEQEELSHRKSPEIEALKPLNFNDKTFKNHPPEKPLQPSKPPPSCEKGLSHYETLLRFASVELEGVIQNQPRKEGN